MLVLPLANEAGGHFLALPNTSSRLHFNRSMICWSRPRVMLCSQFSRRNRVDRGRPVSLDHWANVISPRRFFRNTASFLSREEGDGTSQT